MTSPLQITRKLLNSRSNLIISNITNKKTCVALNVEPILFTCCGNENVLSFKYLTSHRYMWFPKVNRHNSIKLCQNKYQLRSSARIFSSTAPLKDASSQSGIRCNFEKESEDRINSQINMELQAGYVYLSMAFFFDRHDVAMPGFHMYFLNAAKEEFEHAKSFMVYLNQRGGKVVLTKICEPPTHEWETPKRAMEAALNLEKEVNESLLTLHEVAGKHNDANLCDFVEANYLQHQVESIREVAEQLTKIERVGDGLGIFIYDKELYKSVTSSKPH